MKIHLTTSSNRLPLDIRFDLTKVRVLALEEAFRQVDGFLEPERREAIMEDLADSYNDVMVLAFMLGTGEEVEVTGGWSTDGDGEDDNCLDTHFNKFKQ